MAVAVVCGEEKRALRFSGVQAHNIQTHVEGEGMALWVKESQITHMEKVHDDRWLMVVIVSMTSHRVLIIVVHMPQGKTLSALKEMYACMECIMCGD